MAEFHLPVQMSPKVVPGRKFEVRRGALGRGWWLWDPNIAEWGYCLTFDDAIAKLNRRLDQLNRLKDLAKHLQGLGQ